LAAAGGIGWTGGPAAACFPGAAAPAQTGFPKP
jgi:hypothetical protein